MGETTHQVVGETTQGRRAKWLTWRRAKRLGGETMQGETTQGERESGWNDPLPKHSRPQRAMKVSIFPLYIVWTRFREQFWSCNEAVNCCFLNSHNVRLVKIKEGQQFKFFASNAIGVYANKFQSTDKVAFTCTQWKRLSFLFFCQGIKSILIF